MVEETSSSLSEGVSNISKCYEDEQKQTKLHLHQE